MREVLGSPHDNPMHRTTTAVTIRSSLVHMSYYPDAVSFFWNCSRDFTSVGFSGTLNKQDHIIFVLLGGAHFHEHNGFVGPSVQQVLGLLVYSTV